MEKKIDIIPFLAGIVEENTQHYQSDFAYDEKRLQAAMLEISQEDRTFLWMSRPCGTLCVPEREAFIKESTAHITWTHYDYDAEHIKAYRVIVEPGREGAFVLGQVKPLRYGEQVERVKRNAVHAEMVELTFADGTELELPYAAYSGHFHSLINDHGRIERIHYKPGNELELDCVLQKERIASAVRKRTPRKKKPAVR
ncbi:MAG: hypothetical protein OSJ59_22345 [Lachnospiraceae bacterium]|nr:hypothetical protein [Lachnospiraceae bacterium]